MSLEDFHTKALRLVKEADYPEGDTQNRVLRYTIISGLASDKICIKLIKEGKDVTLARVMEITRLEVSTQQHIDRMHETVKIYYVQYGKGSKKKKGRSRPNGGSGGHSSCGGNLTNDGKASNSKGNGRNPPYLLTSAGDVNNLDIRKFNHAKQWKQSAEVVEPKDTSYEKVCMRKSTHLVGIPSSSSDSDPDYFDEFGEPVYVKTHLVHAKEITRRNISSSFQ